ncbi:MAG: hypothetical protein J5659_00685 [Clostridia bacterium]|nr:hypothetical protein [Clostridia bacterium]
MKKIISVALAIFVATVLICPAISLAEGTPTPAFEVSSASVKAGEDFKVTISIKDNPGITSAKFSVKFDTDLKLNSVEFGKDIEGMKQLPQKLTSPIIINWVNGLEDLKKDAVYATLSFTASKSAANGDHEVAISFDPQDVFNVSEKVIDFKPINGVVTISGGKDEAGTRSKAATSSSASSDTKASTDKAADTKKSSAAKSSSKTASKTATENASVTEKSEGFDNGDGNYTGGEEILEFEDENGNPVPTEEASAEKRTTPIWVFAVIATLLIAGAVTIVVIKKKADKKEAE